MTDLEENNVLGSWYNEIVHAGNDKSLFGIAIFSLNKSLLFANNPMQKLLEGIPHQKLLNPSFEKLCQLPTNDSSLIFEGFLTIGDYSRVNNSFPAVVYRKSNELLVLTIRDFENLQQQNLTLHQLNHKINNLQRQLIIEKRNLENILCKLDEKNRELQKSNLQKDKLFSVIAHDLKSPFSGILGFAEILKENIHDLPVKQLQDYANHIYKSTNNTCILLENLLEWASLQREATRFNPVKIGINEVFKEVLQLLDEHASGKDIKINSEIPENIEWTVEVNMLTSVMRNLIINAIKFSSRNSVIKVITRQLNNELEISVADNGTGMPGEVVKKLFRNEFIESQRGTENEKGSGLGLTICKEFVEMHGGKIWAESNPGVGTTVTFTLPSADGQELQPDK